MSYTVQATPFKVEIKAPVFMEFTCQLGGAGIHSIYKSIRKTYIVLSEKIKQVI